MKFCRRSQTLFSVGAIVVAHGSQAHAAELGASMAPAQGSVATRATDTPPPQVAADENGKPIQCGLDRDDISCGTPQFGCMTCGLRQLR